MGVCFTNLNHSTYCIAFSWILRSAGFCDKRFFEISSKCDGEGFGLIFAGWDKTCARVRSPSMDRARMTLHPQSPSHCHHHHHHKHHHRRHHLTIVVVIMFMIWLSSSWSPKHLSFFRWLFFRRARKVRDKEAEKRKREKDTRYILTTSCIYLG